MNVNWLMIVGIKHESKTEKYKNSWHKYKFTGLYKYR
jgi:hypothetical protein